MSTSDSTAKGKWDEVAGKVKQTVGEAVGNDSLANRGTAQQVKGHGEQAWGSVKEAVRDNAAAERDAEVEERRGPRSETTAHDVRESIASTAANVKDSIKSSMEGTKDDRYRKPA